MAIQTINIGTIANDGTGDDLREAFVKVNNNFAELDNRDPEKTTGANLGSAGEGVFAQLNGAEMQFKKIIAGSAVTLTSDNNGITINSSATGLPQLQVFADNTNATFDANNTALTIAGGNLVTTNLVGTTITITSETSLFTDTTPKIHYSNVTANYNITNTSDIKSTIYGVDIRNIKDVAPYLTFDQGLAFPTSFSSSLDYLVDALSVDFDNGTSTFTASALPTADMGTLPTA